MWRAFSLLSGLAAAAASNAAYDPTFDGRFLEEVDALGDAASGEPPSPPSPPAVLVEMAFRAEGDVSTYDEEVKAGIKTAYAIQAGIPVDTVHVDVAPGSVIVTVTITTADATTASAVSSALSSSTSSTTALMSLLSTQGVAITVDEITSSLSVIVPSTPSPSSSLSAGAIAGIVIGSVIGGIILSFVCFKTYKNLADSPGGVPLVGRGSSGAGSSVEITAVKKGNVDVI